MTHTKADLAEAAEQDRIADETAAESERLDAAKLNAAVAERIAAILAEGSATLTREFEAKVSTSYRSYKGREVQTSEPEPVSEMACIIFDKLAIRYCKEALHPSRAELEAATREYETAVKRAKGIRD